MLIHEFRILLPMSVEEYQVAQKYAVEEVSMGETGERVEVLASEPYKIGHEEGLYTHKIYHRQSKVPGWIRALAPKGAFEFHEKTWSAFPHCRTVITNTYMGDRFTLEVLTQHRSDFGTHGNVHGLEEAQWQSCKVVEIDIADLDEESEYKEGEDPSMFRSNMTGRGPLSMGWQGALVTDQRTPHMCCYKLVKAEFKWRMLQGKVESTIQKMQKKMFTNFHRRLFCTMDNWYGSIMDDIRRMEGENMELEIGEAPPHYSTLTPYLPPTT